MSFFSWLKPAFSSGKLAVKTPLPVMVAAAKTQAMPLAATPPPAPSNLPAVNGKPALTREGSFAVTGVERGEIRIQIEECDLLCLMSDGTLLVCSGEQNHALVQSFISRCKMIAPKTPPAVIKRVQEVSPDRLQEIYKGTSNTRAQSRQRVEVLGDEESSQMETMFLQLVRQAVTLGASDIHIWVNEKVAKVFVRVDGLLVPTPIKQGSAIWGNSLAQAIFHSMTDVSGTNYTPAMAQDAMVRNKVQLPVEISSIRVATLPRNSGTNALFFRLFYRGHSQSGDLDDLGYEPSQRDTFHRIASNPYGIIIITGPTGSGKTTTLHVALQQYIARTGSTRNVIMVEDPTEIELHNVIQTSVTNVGDEGRAAAYRGVIRAAMRSDPDAMMISEMRDVATAEAALSAAMTGHFVFTTLHANNAFNAIPRLERMGIPPYLLYDHNIVRGVVAQRLVRKLCNNCSIPMMDNAALEKYGKATMDRLFKTPGLGDYSDRIRLRGNGCQECNQRGSKGRLCVAEIVEMDATLAHPFKNNNPDLAAVLWHDVRKNQNMRDIALLHVQRGKTCPIDAEDVVGSFGDGGNTVKFTEIDAASRIYSQQNVTPESQWSGT
jgi:type II secretory ATPase GspE/PulE/Tfp pilus assembly ATPase PilB-like protein